jgi:chorismate mutase
MATRGVRGATTAAANGAAAILERTLELLRVLIEKNGILPEDVASAVFTVTEDLDAEFPALAVRSLPGWEAVPLICAREIAVPGSLGRGIRILLHWNTEKAQSEIRHAFLRGARQLRPAWAERVPGDDDDPPVRLPLRDAPR